MILIGLSGPAGCGKSTAGVALQQRHGAHLVAFADPIREAVLGLYREWSAHSFEHPAKDRPCRTYGVSPRDALRAFGEHARGLEPLIYVHAMARRLEAIERHGRAHLVVITDVRLPAEAALVRERGGWVVHVERPGYAWAGDHPTECGPGCEPEDRRLQNPGALCTLWSQIEVLLSCVRPRGVIRGRYAR